MTMLSNVINYSPQNFCCILYLDGFANCPHFVSLISYSFRECCDHDKICFVQRYACAKVGAYGGSSGYRGVHLISLRNIYTAVWIDASQVVPTLSMVTNTQKAPGPLPDPEDRMMTETWPGRAQRTGCWRACKQIIKYQVENGITGGCTVLQTLRVKERKIQSDSGVWGEEGAWIWDLCRPWLQVHFHHFALS